MNDCEYPRGRKTKTFYIIVKYWQNPIISSHERYEIAVIAHMQETAAFHRYYVTMDHTL